MAPRRPNEGGGEGRAGEGSAELPAVTESRSRLGPALPGRAFSGPECGQAAPLRGQTTSETTKRWPAAFLGNAANL